LGAVGGKPNRKGKAGVVKKKKEFKSEKRGNRRR